MAELSIGRWDKLYRQPGMTLTDSADSFTTQLVFRGDYGECVRTAPARGDTIVGLSGYVSSVTIASEEANVGTVSITMSTAVGDSSSEAAALILAESHELQYNEVTNDLASHPRYTNNNTGYGSAAEFKFSDPAGITGSSATIGEAAFEAASLNIKDRATFIATIPNETKRNMVIEFSSVYSGGTTSYRTFIPCLISRTEHVKRPSGVGAGWILATNPTSHPLYASVDGADNMKWFKNSDNITYNGPKGGYTRTQTWLGFDVGIDPRFYKTK